MMYWRNKWPSGNPLVGVRVSIGDHWLRASFPQPPPSMLLCIMPEKSSPNSAFGCYGTKNYIITNKCVSPSPFFHVKKLIAESCVCKAALCCSCDYSIVSFLESMLFSSSTYSLVVLNCTELVSCISTGLPNTQDNLKLNYSILEKHSDISGWKIP